MNILDIINRMNAGEVITTAEYNFWMENYDATMHPWIDPLSDYTINDLDDVELDDVWRERVTEELAYDAFAHDYSPTDDGSWVGR